jgi:hypothetical protein
MKHANFLREERLNELAEFFEAGAPHFEFNMDRGFTFKLGGLNEAIDDHCGTPACIAGFVFPMAVRAMDPVERTHVLRDDNYLANLSTTPDGEEVYEMCWDTVRCAAKSYLMLTRAEANDLFEGHQARRFEDMMNGRPRIAKTAADAATAIRNVMRGEPAW